MVGATVQAHGRLILHAALLFCVGLFAAAPVVRFRMRTVAWPALVVFRLILRLAGTSPGIVRLAAVIFGFNAPAMFLYMASGFHPMLPKIFGIWTGMNIAAVSAFVTRGIEPLPPMLRTEAQWAPPSHLTSACSLLVLGLELPCFWLAIAMGMGMGNEVLGGTSYAAALAPRAVAYCALVVPTLLVSAIAEAIAVRGALPPVAAPGTEC